MNDFFAPDYATARARFVQAARDLGGMLWSYPLNGRGPNHESLDIDVAISPGRDERTALVLSSGLHGVEGFLGSAVQAALLRRWQDEPHSAPASRTILIHGLNPHGFAFLRRANEDNVDLNRNLLVDGQRYEGCPEGYRALDALLNPPRPPSRFEPRFVKFAFAIARYGMPALKQAIAAGQYEYPRGLFYGGAAPSATHRLLANHFGEWLGAAERVIHLDFHTGLGPSATCKLLLDYPVDESKRGQLSQWFAGTSLEVSDTSGVAYTATGNFGAWCVARRGTRDYTYAAAEFGTYSAQRVLAGLRAENQAHHWGDPVAASTRRAKEHLLELFCPASPRWREPVLTQSLRLVDQAIRALNP